MPRFINTGRINERKRTKVGPYQITSRTRLGRYLGELLSLNFIEKRTLASIGLSNNHYGIVEPLYYLFLCLFPVYSLHKALYHTNGTRQVLEGTDTEVTYVSGPIGVSNGTFHNFYSDFFPLLFLFVSELAFIFSHALFPSLKQQY